MRKFRWAILLGWLLLSVSTGGISAFADEFAPPGLASDSSVYAATLTRRFPAGATPQAKRTAEQQAAAALAKKDFAASSLALEQRLSMGQPSAQLWTDLANAYLRRIPQDAQKALFAAWLGFGASDAGDPEVAPLLLLAEAFRTLGRPAQAAETLEQVIQRAPDNAAYKLLLADAQKATGLVVRRVRQEAEADPPRACVQFSIAPQRRSDFNAQDWVRLDPPVPEAAVTREADQICVSGLPSGATTRIILRAGLPGEQGLSLARETALSVAMPNRKPSIALDSRMFILPRGQIPALGVSTVNLSAVKLRLLRLSERSVAEFLRDAKLGQTVETYAADRIAETMGSVVWEGRADIPRWQPNKTARTSLPVPDALANAGAGLYALQIRPGDGTNADSAGAVQMILRTDLAPTIWRGHDGLTVQVRRYSDAKTRPGVRMRLIATNNDILAETSTDDLGVVRFALALLHGEGPLAPALVQAFGADGDFATVDLNLPAFDLSDRGVQGAAHPGPLDSFVWLDRGIYRPGETVQVMALLRDDAGRPVDFPAQLRVKRPNGQVFLQTTPARGPDGAIYLPVQLSAGAASGTWTVEIRSDPKADPIGATQFRVDAFVPDRMAVDIGTPPAMLVVGQTAVLPVAARFLYGAPGSDLSGKGTLRLVVDPNPFAALAGYRIGLVGETYAPVSQDIELPNTDAQGKSALKLLIAAAPDTTRPLKAEIEVEVSDPSGHGSKGAISIPVRGANPSIGIKPLFPDDAVDADATAAFDLAAVAPGGARTELRARLRLVRERPDWRMVAREGRASYEIVYRDEPLETRDVVIPAGTPLRFAKALPFGRYRIEAVQSNGLAATSYRFRAGWTAGSDNPDIPDRVDVSTAQRAMVAGQSARIHIAAPFAGEATLLVLSDRVHSLRTLSVPEGGTDVDVPVDASWGPGAYVAVHVFRGGTGAAGSRPNRAVGLTWVGIDPAARVLAVSIEAAEKYAPRAAAVIPVHVAAGAWVSLAAVDEGILRLTRFLSPDPGPHFLGRRKLGLDIRDDWGRLIAPADGEATLLRQGGDDGGFALPDTPTRTVTLFTPPMQAGPDGVARVKLDLPDFNGQVRLMAVAWSGSGIGAANADILVRDPLVAEPLLPRFLAPGDETRLAVLLQNVDLPLGNASVVVSVDGPLALVGEGRMSAMLAPGERALPATTLRATGAGRGVVHLDIADGPFRLRRDTAITVRPSRGAVSMVSAGELAPGAEIALAPPIALFVPGTWRAEAVFGAPVRYDAQAMIQALADYPLSCLEQTASRGLPLAAMPAAVATAGQQASLQAAVASVLDRQRYDGGFALWSANGAAEQWLSAYAMDFLWRAKAAGAAVPDQAMTDGLKFIGDAANGDNESPEDTAAQAYRLYVLAEAGRGRPGAVRVLAQDLARLPTPLARAQIAAALAMAHDQPGAEAAFAQALRAPERRWWQVDYGSTLRDQAAMAVLLKESGLAPALLTRLIGTLPGAELQAAAINTQEQAWTAAASEVLGRDGRPPNVSVNGRALPKGVVQRMALDGPATARNNGDRPVWRSVSVSGVTIQAPPAARNLMRIRRNFMALDGTPLNLEQLRQSTVFVLLLEGRIDDDTDRRAVLLQGLPAGWEIAGRFGEGDAPGLPWLGKLTATEAQPAADDRFAAVLGLSKAQPEFRVAVRLRAVTPGDYELPGAELSDMYAPGVFARQGANRIKVLPSQN